MTEEMLRGVSVPVALLRAAWFMENAPWDVGLRLISAQAGTDERFLAGCDLPTGP
jgi:NAD(P)H dehydrogenase (quinone)